MIEGLNKGQVVTPYRRPAKVPSPPINFVPPELSSKLAYDPQLLHPKIDILADYERGRFSAKL